MKYGFFKPGHKICFREDDTDHSAISVEITRIIRIFADHGHECFILSDTDYLPGSIKNVSREVLGPLDKVFVYNGKGLTKDIVENLKKYTQDINLIITDLSLSSGDMTSFRDIYTQSKRMAKYGAIQEHECYGYTPYIPIKDAASEKYIDFYFGGTERGRTKDFFEYVIRPNVLWHGKSETLGMKDYISYDAHIENMKHTKYSIVIGDESYNEIGFITPRYYECIRYGVIPFVDMKYDPDEIMITKDDFRRVSSYIDMLSKIKQLEENPKLYADLLKNQEKEITQDMIEGNNILKLLTS